MQEHLVFFIKNLKFYQFAIVDLADLWRALLFAAAAGCDFMSDWKNRTAEQNLNARALIKINTTKV
jgi:hypothetical protein